MIIQERDYDFKCDDLIALVEEPENYAILSKDFLIPVGEDLGKMQETHLSNAQSLFRSAKFVQHTSTEDNGEFRVQLNDKRQPCYVMYLSMYVSIPKKISPMERMFELAALERLNMFPRQFFYWPQSIQNKYLEENIDRGCSEEDIDIMDIRCGIDDRSYDLLSLLTGSNNAWKRLNDHEFEAAIRDIRYNREDFSRGKTLSKK